MKDLSGRKGAGASLGQIFSIIERAKAELPRNPDEESKAATHDLPVSSQDLLDAVNQEGLIVFRRDDEEKRQVAVTESEAAFFALLAADMLELAEKYKRDVDQVHRLFFEVSCDRERLVKILEGGKSVVDKWDQMEDLAAREGPESQAFKYVMQKKGPNEISKRRKFLELE